MSLQLPLIIMQMNYVTGKLTIQNLSLNETQWEMVHVRTFVLFHHLYLKIRPFNLIRLVCLHVFSLSLPCPTNPNRNTRNVMILNFSCVSKQNQLVSQCEDREIRGLLPQSLWFPICPQGDFQTNKSMADKPALTAAAGHGDSRHHWLTLPTKRDFSALQAHLRSFSPVQSGVVCVVF